MFACNRNIKVLEFIFAISQMEPLTARGTAFNRLHYLHIFPLETSIIKYKSDLFKKTNCPFDKPTT